MPKNTASARPRSVIGYAATTIASAAGNSSAAKAPCTTRNPISQAWPRSPVGVAPHSAELTAKPVTPIMTMRRWPSTSASLPPSTNSAERASR